MKCLIGASFVNPANTIFATTMRERYYASLDGGSLDRDGELFSDMLTTTSSATVGMSMVEIAVTLDADWTLPAFLGNTKTNGNGDALTPTIELLCVDLRYPSAGMAAASDITMLASVGSVHLLSTTVGTFSGVSLKPKDGVGNPSFSFLPESTEPLYVGEWSLTIADYGLDVDADTYIDIMIPDSHAYEFKQAASDGQTYEPTEAYYSPSQSSINGVRVLDVIFPTYSYFAEPTANPLIVGDPADAYSQGMRLTVHIADAISNNGADTISLRLRCSSVRNPMPVASTAALKLVVYDQQYKDALDTASENPFDGYADASASPLIPVTQVLLEPIVEKNWGQNAFSSFTMVNNTAGHESTLATLTMKPHNLPISARGHVSFALPTVWKVADVVSSSSACVASAEGRSAATLRSLERLT
jgi:hypothetical protein